MKPVAYMIWAPFSGPAQFTTDPRAPEMAAQRADYTCTPLVTEHDALAAIEKARREERMEILDLAATLNPSRDIQAYVAAIRARVKGK